MPTELATHQLQTLQDDLHALRDQRLGNHAFSTRARAHSALLAALPCLGHARPAGDAAAALPPPPASATRRER